jgi:hypothetical protein
VVSHIDFDSRFSAFFIFVFFWNKKAKLIKTKKKAEKRESKSVLNP